MSERAEKREELNIQACVTRPTRRANNRLVTPRVIKKESGKREKGQWSLTPRQGTNAGAGAEEKQPMLGEGEEKANGGARNEPGGEELSKALEQPEQKKNAHDGRALGKED